MDRQLWDAARAWNLAGVESALAEDGTNVNAAFGPGDSTSLHEAALNGPVEIVRVLLAANADVNSTDNGGEMPLHYASLEGQSEVVQILLDAGLM